MDPRPAVLGEPRRQSFSELESGILKTIISRTCTPISPPKITVAHSDDAQVLDSVAT